MTCHCQTKAEHAERALDRAKASANWAAPQREREARQREEAHAERIRELDQRTPNPDEYTVEEVEQAGRNLVLKVRYPGCAGCSFDRCKVMVYLGVDLKDVVRWQRIDPHFRAPATPPAVTVTPIREAPSPAARFPASAEGWADALEYARRKGGTP